MGETDVGEARIPLKAGCELYAVTKRKYPMVLINRLTFWHPVTLSGKSVKIEYTQYKEGFEGPLEFYVKRATSCPRPQKNAPHFMEQREEISS